MKPTNKQIDQEYFDLKAMIDRVPRYSKFHDDNHAQIHAQMEVVKSKMSEEKAWDRFCPEGAEGEPPAELDAALEAVRWILGEEKQAPSKNWESIAK